MPDQTSAPTGASGPVDAASTAAHPDYSCGAARTVTGLQCRCWTYCATDDCGALVHAEDITPGTAPACGDHHVEPPAGREPRVSVALPGDVSGYPMPVGVRGFLRDILPRCADPLHETANPRGRAAAIGVAIDRGDLAAARELAAPLGWEVVEVPAPSRGH